MISLLLAYIKRNAFKIAIIAILLFVAVRKEFSFSINMNAPKRQPVRTETKTRESFTEKVEPHQQAAVTDRLELPKLWGNNHSEEEKPEIQPEEADAPVKAYIRRFSHVAQAEQVKFGIPASIILANSLYQSQAGQKEYSKKGNNHFGLPCTEDWLGESGQYQGDCLRHYENAWTSFRDHSFFITTGRFASLNQLRNKSYKVWAKSLEKSGFRDQPGLAEELIRIIQKYQLDRLD